MSLAHALLWIDHENAKVLQFDAHAVEAEKLHVHHHATRQHGSEVRAVHEFYGAVCDRLAAIPQVVVMGPRVAQGDFRHYVTKHRPSLDPQIVGWEVTDHATDGQLVALARRHFDKLARMAGLP